MRQSPVTYQSGIRPFSHHQTPEIVKVLGVSCDHSQKSYTCVTDIAKAAVIAVFTKQNVVSTTGKFYYQYFSILVSKSECANNVWAEIQWDGVLPDT